MNTPLLLLAGLVGLGVGAAHFGSLHWLCRHLAALQAGDWWKLAALHLLRWAVLVASGVWAARLGAPALLMLAGGLLSARALIVWRVRAMDRPGRPMP